MGGIVQVESREGEGSTFSVVIPDIRVSNMNVKRTEVFGDVRNVTFEKATLLVVDDVLSNLEMVENLLSSSGLGILTADNGETALEILNHTVPDVILLDLRMPGMDGFEVARRIKENHRLKHVPVLAFTASVFSTEKLEESELFDGFILKPVSYAELTHSLKKFLNHSIKEIEPIEVNHSVNLEIPEALLNKLPDIIRLLKGKFCVKCKEAFPVRGNEPFEKIHHIGLCHAQSRKFVCGLLILKRNSE
jgi:CheY-like chemotaxis protein